MLETTNLKLKKQELTDPADITQINPNWDAIDSELVKKFDKAGGEITGDVTVTGSITATDTITANKINVTGTITANTPNQDNELATKAYVDAKVGEGTEFVRADGVDLRNKNITKGQAPAQAQNLSVNFFDKDGTNPASDRLASVSYQLNTDKTASLNLLVSDPNTTTEDKQSGIRIQNVAGTPRIALTNHPLSDANDHSIASTAWVRGLKATTTTEGLVKIADEDAFLNPTDPNATVNVPLMYEINDFRRISTKYELGDRVACAFKYDLFLECTKAGTTSSSTLDTRNVIHDQIIKDGTLEWTVRTHIRSVDGVTADADGDVKLGYTSLVVKPQITSPSNGSSNVSTQTELTASAYKCIISEEARKHREFQLVKDSDPNFGAPFFSKQVNADKVALDSALEATTSYRWRCRDISVNGLYSKWSDIATFTTNVGVTVNTPTVTVSDNGDKYVIDGAEASLSNSQNVNHTKSEFVVCKTSAPDVEVWSRKDTTPKLTSVDVPKTNLEVGTEYIAKVRYYDGTLQLWSDWGSNTFTAEDVKYIVNAVTMTKPDSRYASPCVKLKPKFSTTPAMSDYSTVFESYKVWIENEQGEEVIPPSYFSNINQTDFYLLPGFPNFYLKNNTKYIAKAAHVLKPDLTNVVPFEIQSTEFTTASTFNYINAPKVTVSANPDATKTIRFTTPALSSVPAGSLFSHTSTTWRIQYNGEIIWRSDDDTVNKTSITLPADTLENGKQYCVYAFHYNAPYGYSSLQYTWFTPEGVVVNQPTVNIEGGVSDVGETPTVTSSAFALTPSSTSTSGQHVSTTWKILKHDDSSLIYESANDTTNKTSITIPKGKLVTGTTYVAQCIHNSKDYGSSAAGEITFRTNGKFNLYKAPKVSVDTNHIEIDGKVVPNPVFNVSEVDSNVSNLSYNTDWQIVDIDTKQPVFSRTTNGLEKSWVVIDENVLLPNKSYRMSAKYSYGSNQSDTGYVDFMTAKTFHEITPPEFTMEFRSKLTITADVKNYDANYKPYQFYYEIYKSDSLVSPVSKGDMLYANTPVYFVADDLDVEEGVQYTVRVRYRVSYYGYSDWVEQNYTKAEPAKPKKPVITSFGGYEDNGVWYPNIEPSVRIDECESSDGSPIECLKTIWTVTDDTGEVWREENDGYKSYTRPDNFVSKAFKNLTFGVMFKTNLGDSEVTTREYNTFPVFGDFAVEIEEGTTDVSLTPKIKVNGFILNPKDLRSDFYRSIKYLTKVIDESLPNDQQVVWSDDTSNVIAVLGNGGLTVPEGTLAAGKTYIAEVKLTISNGTYTNEKTSRISFTTAGGTSTALPTPTINGFKILNDVVIYIDNYFDIIDSGVVIDKVDWGVDQVNSNISITSSLNDTKNLMKIEFLNVSMLKYHNSCDITVRYHDSVSNQWSSTVKMNAITVNESSCSFKTTGSGTFKMSDCFVDSTSYWNTDYYTVTNKIGRTFTHDQYADFSEDDNFTFKSSNDTVKMFGLSFRSVTWLKEFNSSPRFYTVGGVPRTEISSMFSTASKLQTVSNDLFDYNWGLTKFNLAFNGCNSLIKLPTLRRLLNLTDASYYASNITNTSTTIDSDAFYYCISLTNVSGMFKNYKGQLPDTLDFRAKGITNTYEFATGSARITVRVPKGSTSATTFKSTANVNVIEVEEWK